MSTSSKKINLPPNDAGQGVDNSQRLYHPTVADVLAIKESLLVKLPIEVIDAILDYAEYWPHTHVSWRQTSATSRCIIRAPANEDQFLLRSYPLGYIPKERDLTDTSFEAQGYPNISPSPGPDLTNSSQELKKEILRQWAQEAQMRGEFPCRKIVFTLRSHDQGWAGDRDGVGCYKNSYTWFDVGKEEVCISEKIETPAGLPADQYCNSSFQGSENNMQVSKSSSLMTENLWSLPLRILPFQRDSSEIIASDKLCDPYFIVHPGEESSKCNDLKFLVCTSRTICPTTDSDVVNSPGSKKPLRKIYKFNHPILPDSKALQKNLKASNSTKEHVITWSYDDHIKPDSSAANKLEEIGRGVATANGEYVRNLRSGEIVTLWGKSRFQGWANYVEGVSIDIYWAV